MTESAELFFLTLCDMRYVKHTDGRTAVHTEDAHTGEVSILLDLKAFRNVLRHDNQDCPFAVQS